MGITAERVLDQLVERLGVEATPEKSVLISKNINAMNKINDRYIARMAELVNLGDPETLRTTLKMLEEESFVPAFISDAKFLNDELGSKFDAATAMLDSLTLTLFVKRFRVSVGLDNFFPSPVTSDQLIISANPSIRPDLTEVSIEDAYQYCESLAVASHLINPAREKAQFISEAPDFIEWASTHPNREELFKAALRLNTIRKASLEELVDVSVQTEPALRDGAL